MTKFYFNDWYYNNAFNYVAGSIYFLFWISNGNQFSLKLVEAVGVPVVKHRNASGRLADEGGYGYETLKLTIIPKSKIISEPLVLAIHELPELCGLFTSCFGTEQRGKSLFSLQYQGDNLDGF